MAPAVVRALASHQCGLGSIPTQCHVWVEFVVGSRLAPSVSPDTPVFPLPQKPASPNSNSTRIEKPHKKQLRLM